MADKKTKIQVAGVPGWVEAVEVAVDESNEPWTNVKLADGTTLRLKTVILGVLRLEGQYDPDGNPMYQVKANQVMTANPPDHLKKGAPKAH